MLESNNTSAPPPQFNPKAVFITFLHPKVAPLLRFLKTPEDLILLRKRGEELRNRPTALVSLNNPLAWTLDMVARYSVDFQRKWIFRRVLRINQLPAEILLHIFHLVSWSPDNLPTLSLSLLRLTWVCQKWRYTAIKATTLWSMVWFEDRFPYERSLAFIERAGSTPLDIRISERHEGWCKEYTDNLNGNLKDGHPFTAKMMEHVMDRLLPKIRTIRTLVITVDTWEPALVVLNRLRDSYYLPEQLERFELHQTGRPWLWAGPMPELRNLSSPIPFCDHRTLPHLTYVCFNGLHIQWSIPQMANLYVLDIRRVPIDNCPSNDDFRDMLKASPRLSKLTLHAAGPRWVSTDVIDANLPPVHLPYLTTLVIGDFAVSYAIYILNTFTANNVIDLTVLNMVGDDYGPLVEHLTGRFPDIRLVTIHSVQLLDSALNKRRTIEWLRSMPKIEVLKVAQLEEALLQYFLENPNTREDTADSFTPQTPSIPLLPELRALEYQSIAFGCISRFVEGRKRIGAPLKKIYVISPWFIQMRVEEKNWLAGMAQLHQLNVGMPNLEELHLKRAWTKVSGIPFAYLY